MRPLDRWRACCRLRGGMYVAPDCPDTAVANGSWRLNADGHWMDNSWSVIKFMLIEYVYINDRLTTSLSQITCKYNTFRSLMFQSLGTSIATPALTFVTHLISWITSRDVKYWFISRKCDVIIRQRVRDANDAAHYQVIKWKQFQALRVSKPLFHGHQTTTARSTVSFPPMSMPWQWKYHTDVTTEKFNNRNVQLELHCVTVLCYKQLSMLVASTSGWPNAVCMPIWLVSHLSSFNY